MIPLELDTVIFRSLDEVVVQSGPLYSFHLISKSYFSFKREVALGNFTLFLWHPRTKDNLIDPLAWDFLHVESRYEGEYAHAISLKPRIC